MMMCYIRTGEICSATALFDEMPDKDLVSWSTMVVQGILKFQIWKRQRSYFWKCQTLT
jgi:hypothetical protein